MATDMAARTFQRVLQSKDSKKEVFYLMTRYSIEEDTLTGIMDVRVSRNSQSWKAEGKS